MSPKKSSSSRSGDGPLGCPSCGLRHALDERFCSRCRMPLIYVGAAEAPPAGEAQERARKINPEFAEGELVRVAGGRHQAEAELIQGLLLEEGVPSVLRRAAGFDVPDFLAAGPRDVLVPESGAQAARQVLLQADMAPPDAPPQQAVRLPRLFAIIAGGGGLTALVAWGLIQLAD